MLLSFHSFLWATFRQCLRTKLTLADPLYRAGTQTDRSSISQSPLPVRSNFCCSNVWTAALAGDGYLYSASPSAGGGGVLTVLITHMPTFGGLLLSLFFLLGADSLSLSTDV